MADAPYRAKKADLVWAQVTWERGRRLIENNAISRQQVDDKRAMVDSLAAGVEAAKARYEQLIAPARADELAIAQARVDVAQAESQLASFRLERTILLAPSPGRILDINVEPGERFDTKVRETRPCLYLSVCVSMWSFSSTAFRPSRPRQE